ncbi:uncharacterized protein LOC144139021 isoform X3 [Haemaphysalis longicornis]
MKFLLTTASLLLVYICCVTTTNYSTRRRPSLFCNMTSANRTKVLKCFGEKYPKDMQAKWRKNYTVIQKGEVDNVTGWATPPKNPYEHTNWTWQNLQDFQRLWAEFANPRKDDVMRKYRHCEKKVLKATYQ